MAECFLRLAAQADGDDLYGLMCLPDVYRYLSDGEPPPDGAVRAWIARGIEERSLGLGLWLLVSDDGASVGAVRLTADDQPPRSAELIYLLHPNWWGRGLATGMGFAVVQHALHAGQIDRIVAGADAPNVASVAVMRRLGMRFHRSVQYPLGPGVEYELRRDAAELNPPPVAVEIR